MAILVTHLPYETAPEDVIAGCRVLRSFRLWSVYRSCPADASLVVVDHQHRRVTKFQYETLDAWWADLGIIADIQEGGDADETGVPAVPAPTPPPVFARDAQPLPESVEELEPGFPTPAIGRTWRRRFRG